MSNALSPERCRYNLTQLIFLQCLSANGCPDTCHSSPHTHPSHCSTYRAWQGSATPGDRAPLQLQKAGPPAHYLTWSWNRGAKTSYQHYWVLTKTCKEHRFFDTTCLFWQKGEAPLHWIFETLLFKDGVAPRTSACTFTLRINTMTMPLWAPFSHLLGKQLLTPDLLSQNSSELGNSLIKT